MSDGRPTRPTGVRASEPRADDAARVAGKPLRERCLDHAGTDRIHRDAVRARSCDQPRTMMRTPAFVAEYANIGPLVLAASDEMQTMRPPLPSLTICCAVACTVRNPR